MRGIIWYYTSEDIGLQRLEKLIEEYRSIRIEVVHRTKREVAFDNGDFWRIAPCNDNSRGQSCNVALIERGTPKEIEQVMIMRCIKQRPYRAYNYYQGDSE